MPSGSRITSANAAYNDHTRQSSDVLPSSLRASSSAANLDLYVAPYERNRNSQLDNLSRDFGEFGISGTRRRESYPVSLHILDRLFLIFILFQPVPGQYAQDPQQIRSPYSTFTNYPPGGYGYDQSQSIPENGPIHPYERPLTPNDQAQLHYQQTSTNMTHGYGSQPYHQTPYETTSPVSYQPSIRGPRHSVPTSSGFVPLPQASGFVPITSHMSEPSGFSPPPSHTPVPNPYISQFNSYPQSGYLPPVSHTPIPVNNGSYLQHSTSLSFPQQSYSSPQSYGYNYGIPSSVSAPPQQFMTSTPAPPQTNQASQIYTSASPSHEILPGQAPPPPLVNGQTSRPLPPQPQVVYAQQPVPSPPTMPTSHSLPSPNGVSQTPVSYSPTQPGNIYPSNTAYASVPPPPPPLHQYNNTAPITTKTPNFSLPPPPPPPPPSSLNSQTHRRASLPQPPIAYQQQQQPQQVHEQQQQMQPQQHQPQNLQGQGQGQPLPLPPPPPPLEYHNQNQLPLPPPPPPLLNPPAMSQSGSYHQLPPPKAPQVDEYGQWIHPNSQQTSHAY